MGCDAMLMATMVMITRVPTELMIPMAPTAKSPPYSISRLLSSPCTPLPAICMANGAIPIAVISPSMGQSTFRLLRRSLMTDWLPLKWRRTQTVSTIIEMTVAQAAPFTPIPNPKIKIGSRTRLVPALISIETMAVRTLPSERIMLFREKPTTWKTTPRRMMLR